MTAELRRSFKLKAKQAFELPSRFKKGLADVGSTVQEAVSLDEEVFFRGSMDASSNFNPAFFEPLLPTSAVDLDHRDIMAKLSQGDASEEFSGFKRIKPKLVLQPKGTITYEVIDLTDRPKLTPLSTRTTCIQFILIAHWMLYLRPTFFVKARDTLASIAAQFDTTTSELRKLNKLMSDFVIPGRSLYVRDKDYIPSEPSSRGSTPPNSPSLTGSGSVEDRGDGSRDGLDETGISAQDIKRRLYPDFLMMGVKPFRFAIRQGSSEEGGRQEISGVMLVTPGAIMFEADNPVTSSVEAEKPPQSPGLQTTLGKELDASPLSRTSPTSQKSSVESTTLQISDNDPSAAPPLGLELTSRTPITPSMSPIPCPVTPPPSPTNISSSEAPQERQVAPQAAALIGSMYNMIAPIESISSIVLTYDLGLTLAQSTTKIRDSMIEDEVFSEQQARSEPDLVAQISEKGSSEANLCAETRVTTEQAQNWESAEQVQFKVSPEDEQDFLEREILQYETGKTDEFKIEDLESKSPSTESASTNKSFDMEDLELARVMLSRGPEENGSSVSAVGSSGSMSHTFSQNVASSSPGKQESTSTRIRGGSLVRNIFRFQYESSSSAQSSLSSAGGAASGKEAMALSSGESTEEGTGAQSQGLVTRTFSSITSYSSSLANLPSSLFSRTSMESKGSVGDSGSLSSSPKAATNLPAESDSSTLNQGSDKSSEGNRDSSLPSPRSFFLLPLERFRRKKENSTEAESATAEDEEEEDESERPLYLRLRIGNIRTSARSGPFASFIRTRLKPEYWFRIPEDKADELYTFFILWAPAPAPCAPEAEAPESDKLERGFIVVDPQDTGMRDGVRRRCKRRGKKWEMMNAREMRRMMSLAEIESLPLPELSERSSIFSEQHIRELSFHLPARAEGCRWRLLYSTSRDGFSLTSLYRNVHKTDSHVLLAIRDDKDEVFGAMLPCGPRISDHFYGTGESYLFTFHQIFKKYCWTGENNYFIKGNSESLAVGAGEGVYGLWLDADLFHGRTQKCLTYDNDLLTESEDFVIKSVEVWSFV